MAETTSVKCEINIYGAKNIVTKKQGTLFVRCYLSVGKKNNKRVQLNTREIMSSKNFDGDEHVFWDETFSLTSTSRSTNYHAKDGNLEFELRWRSASTNVLGQKSHSKLLARGEMSCNWVKHEDEDEDEDEGTTWVSMVRVGGSSECWDVKPPALRVGVKVEVEEEDEEKTVVVVKSRQEMRRRRRQERLRNWDECGCGCGCSNACCVDSELFLVASVVDVC
ncbi:hypothetical protein vseg_019357 [Gypsophila vaccaria]